MTEDVRLMMGDCLERMSEVADQSVDLVLCDLPYGTTACAWDSVIPFEPLWAHYWRVCRGAVVLTSSQPFTSVLVNSQLVTFKHEWIWQKNRGNNFLRVKREPMKEHENVCVFAKNKWTYNPIMQHRTGGGVSRVGYKFNVRPSSDHHNDVLMPKKTQNVMRVPSSWQKFICENGLHPTQKPVALMEYMV